MFALSFALTCFGVVLAGKIRSFEGFGVFSNTLILPMYFASSSVFPLDPSLSLTQLSTSYPEWLLWLIRINPITYAVDALRGILIGFHQFPAMAGYALVAAGCAGLFLWALRSFGK